MTVATDSALVTARVSLKVRKLAELAASERSISLSKFAAEAIRDRAVVELTGELAEERS